MTIGFFAACFIVVTGLWLLPPAIASTEPRAHRTSKMPLPSLLLASCRSISLSRPGAGGGLQLAVGFAEQSDTVDLLGTVPQAHHPVLLRLSSALSLENTTASLLNYEVFLDDSNPVPASIGHLLPGEHRALAGSVAVFLNFTCARVVCPRRCCVERFVHQSCCVRCRSPPGSAPPNPT